MSSILSLDSLRGGGTSGRWTGGSAVGVLIAVLAVAVSGCGAGPVVAPVPVPADEVVAFGDFGRGEIGVPDDGVTASLAELAVIYGAVQRVTEQCMHARGFGYVAIDAGEEGQWEPLAVGPTDPMLLRRHGYAALASDVRNGQRRDPRTSSGGGDDPNARIVAGMRANQSQRWSTALFGADDAGRVTLMDPDGNDTSMRQGGCYQQGLTAVLGSVGAHLNLDAGAIAIRDRAQELLHADPDFLASYEHWRDCMAEQGRAAAPLNLAAADGQDLYAAPLAAAAYLSLPIGKARAEEAAIAAADASCQEQTGLDEITREGRDRAVGRAAIERGYDLVGRRALVADAYARARALGSPASSSR